MGLFRDVESSSRALQELAAAGIGPENLSAISSTPFPEGTFGVHPERGRLPWITFGAALIGIGVGFSVAAGTALLWPLPTGGKPILSLPPIGIVTFEVMMLFGLIATFLGALFQMQLYRIKGRAYSPRVSDGEIAVLVRCLKTEMLPLAEDILGRSGAREIQRIPGDAL